MFTCRKVVFVKLMRISIFTMNIFDALQKEHTSNKQFDSPSQRHLSTWLFVQQHFLELEGALNWVIRQYLRQCPTHYSIPRIYICNDKKRNLLKWRSKLKKAFSLISETTKVNFLLLHSTLLLFRNRFTYSNILARMFTFTRHFEFSSRISKDWVPA